jgi:hypothetical protein
MTVECRNQGLHTKGQYRGFAQADHDTHVGLGHENPVDFGWSNDLKVLVVLGGLDDLPLLLRLRGILQTAVSISYSGLPVPRMFSTIPTA